MSLLHGPMTTQSSFVSHKNIKEREKRFQQGEKGEELKAGSARSARENKKIKFLSNNIEMIENWQLIPFSSVSIYMMYYVFDMAEHDSLHLVCFSNLLSFNDFNLPPSPLERERALLLIIETSRRNVAALGGDYSAGRWHKAHTQREREEPVSKEPFNFASPPRRALVLFNEEELSRMTASLTYYIRGDRYI